MDSLLITGGTLWNGSAFLQKNALLISGGLIAAAGPEEEVRSAAGRTCRELRLEGESVLPGITDSHIHLATWAKQQTLLDLSPARTLPEVLSLVKDEAEKLPPDRWIRGWNYNDSHWPEGRSITKSDLDGLGLPHPILLQRVCTHVNVADSRALALSGIESETGVLLEREGIPALRAMEHNVFSRPSLRSALKKACFGLASWGITCAHPCGALDYGMEEDLALYMDLRREGSLPLRIFSYHDALPSPTLPTGFGDGWVHYQGLKIFLDGSLGGRTAALTSPYRDDEFEEGRLNWTDGEVYEKLRSARERGIQTLLHAIGDRALDQGLRCIERLDGEFGPPRLRDRINHLMVCRPDQRRRLAALELFCDIQPAFVPSDLNMAGSRLGKARMPWAYRWRSLWKKGLVLCASSDAPVESVNPWQALRDLMERSSRDGREILAPEERLTLEEGLPLFTSNPARALGQEDRLGRLAPGFCADLVILDRNIAPLTSEEIAAVEPRYVFAGGVLSRGELGDWASFER
ncbi:amidohydrolase [Aminivibrio sp.]